MTTCVECIGSYQDISDGGSQQGKKNWPSNRSGQCYPLLEWLCRKQFTGFKYLTHISKILKTHNHQSSIKNQIETNSDPPLLFCPCNPLKMYENLQIMSQLGNSTRKKHVSKIMGGSPPFVSTSTWRDFFGVKCHSIYICWLRFCVLNPWSNQYLDSPQKFVCDPRFKTGCVCGPCEFWLLRLEMGLPRVPVKSRDGQGISKHRCWPIKKATPNSPLKNWGG